MLSRSADDQLAGAPPAPETGSAAVANAADVNAAVVNAAVVNADVPTTTESLKETATENMAASDEPELIVEAALPEFLRDAAVRIMARADGRSEHV